MNKNFREIKSEFIEEANSTGHLYMHEKTGARLLYLENDDENRTFGIGFRTPPTNSKGINHIIEHSVLNGSEKYPVKEPFMEMIKTSLQTFLNAMTYPDKTIYPVASRNEKDFKNLMDVYLDAVFNPLIKTRKTTFMQEGWHHEIFDKDEDIVYNGVVYNEMKGALSSAESQVEDEIYEKLYPTSIYGYESGGNPYEIPKLSYEEFLDYYNSYYHPSNSYIFLYGRLDIDEYMEILQSYLKNYEKNDLDSHIDQQERFTEPVKKEAKYSIAPGESTDKKSYFSYSVILGEKENPLDDMTASILCDVLVDMESSKIKKRLLEEGIGEDIYGDTYTGVDVPLTITAKNCDPKDFDRFIEIIEDCLKEVVEEGLDKDQLKASLNRTEFSLREMGNYATKGIILYIQSLETWLYNDDPFESLKFEAKLNQLRENIEGDYFENFIKKRIIDNPHKLYLKVDPEEGMNQKKDEKEKERLKEFKDSLSDLELNQLIEENKKLRDIQNSPDSEEAQKTLPRLKLSDVDTDLKEIPREETEISGAKALYHDIFTNHITYIDLSFDVNHLEKEEMPKLSLLLELIGNLSTENYSYDELETKTYLKTGGIYFSPQVYNKNDGSYDVRVNLSSKANPGFLKDMVELMGEEIFSTKFDEVDRFKDLVRMIKSRNEMGIIASGHQFTVSRVKSYYSRSAKINQGLNGLDFYWYIQDLERDMEENAEGYLADLKDLYKRVFNKKNLIINITSSRESFDEISGYMDTILDRLPCEDLKVSDKNFPLEVLNEGIKSSSDVQFVVKGASYKDLGQDYSGKMTVIGKALSNSYLYSQIRAQGGAYGVGLTFDKSYSFNFYSYRDPNLKRTLDVYDTIPQYLKDMDISDEDLKGFIIGSMNSFNPPMTAQTQGTSDLSDFITGRSLEDTKREMEEALNTKKEDFKNSSSLIEEGLGKNYLAALGNSQKIEENRDLFKNIVKLNK